MAKWIITFSLIPIKGLIALLDINMILDVSTKKEAFVSKNRDCRRVLGTIAFHLCMSSFP